MPNVRMPDGTVVAMPDQIDPALGARLRAFQDAQAAKTSAPKDTSTGPLDVVKGVADAGVSGLAKLSTGLVGGGAGLMSRLAAAATGGDPQAAADATKAWINKTFGYNTTTPVGQAIGHATETALAPVGNAVNATGDLIERGGEAIGIPREATHAQLSEAGELINTLPMVNAAARGGMAASEAADLAAANAPRAVANYGFRTAEDSPIARNVAGQSGREALTAHNQPLADTVAGAEAGVPHGTQLTSQAFANGRTAPNTVYQRVADSLPTGPLSPKAQDLVRSAGGAGQRITDGSPDAMAGITSLKSQLLNPNGNFTGNQVVNEMRGLRQEGYGNAGSEDVSKQQLGRAQLDMARALEQHVADSIPEGATTSLQQLQDARVALAKNHAVEGATKGGHVDMQALARMSRADPDMFTGPLSDIAQFGDLHPEVSTLPPAGTRYNPPGFARDLSDVKIEQPNTWAQALFGALARQRLTGGAGEAMSAARGAPVRGLADEFAPLEPEPLNLKPPPGQAYSPNQPQLATGAPTQRDFFGTGANAIPGGLSTGARGPTPSGAPGDIPLADLLSQGVEQNPSEGLSAGPMGSPQGEGLPFRVNADHAAGDLALQHEPSLMDLLQDLHDMPEVMHQNKSLGVGTNAAGGQGRVMATGDAVPDGTMTRAANNASGESSASLEAINRTAREQAQGQDRFLIDPDGKMWPVRGVEAADARAQPGSILVQKGVGGDPYSILDRGGLPRSHAQGLLNRALSGGNGLTLMDLLSNAQ